MNLSVKTLTPFVQLHYIHTKPLCKACRFIFIFWNILPYPYVASIYSPFSTMECTYNKGIHNIYELAHYMNAIAFFLTCLNLSQLLVRFTSCCQPQLV